MAKYELIECSTWVYDDGSFIKNTGVIYDVSDTETDEEIIKRMCTEKKQFSSEMATWLSPINEKLVRIVNRSESEMTFKYDSGYVLGKLVRIL